MTTTTDIEKITPEIIIDVLRARDDKYTPPCVLVYAVREAAGFDRSGVSDPTNINVVNKIHRVLKAHPNVDTIGSGHRKRYVYKSEEEEDVAKAQVAVDALIAGVTAAKVAAEAYGIMDRVVLHRSSQEVTMSIKDFLKLTTDAAAVAG